MQDVRPRTQELPVPQNIVCPYDERYQTDVLVVGCGFAGLNAAVSAKEQGQNVLVIDKGKPGYSGLTPWASSFRWFDKKRDDADAFRKAIQVGGDYIANLHSYDLWIEESEKIYHRLSDWGILVQYPRAADTGDFGEKGDAWGYREFYDKFDRRQRFEEVLKKYGIPALEHTMVVSLMKDSGAVTGCMALHVPSGKVIAVEAKAIVLATGGGSYKPTGYPTGGNTFDGEYMAYELGLPITGKEFEDFHKTAACAPGNVYVDNRWPYLENIWLCGGDITKEEALGYANGKGNAMVVSRMKDAVYGMAFTDGSEIADVAKDNYTRRGASAVYGTDPDEVRSGKRTTPCPKSMLAGGATGMCAHLASGVFCGLYDDIGATSVPGLYVAGDGIHATSPSGSAYPCGVGFTSCFTSIDGDHAGRAAAIYASSAEAHPLKDEEINDAREEILKPLTLDKGYDPNWARDVLHSIMAPYWVTVAKSEPMLLAALTSVEYMRDHVVPKLAARTGHDLRLCAEMKHKVLSAELKLRAGLLRKESRGNHFREDYPYRDENYLCYFTLTKDADKNIVSDRVELPKEWVGDLSQPYDKRYGFYYPGEPEAKGFTPPVRRRPGGGKPGDNASHGADSKMAGNGGNRS